MQLAILTTAIATAALFSGCTPPEASNRQVVSANGNAQKPSVTITKGVATRPTPITDIIPAEVLNTEIGALNGGTFRLSDFKDKTIVLNFWATWCGPCRSEIPKLVEMNKEYSTKGVKLIGLTTENPQTDAESVRDFAEQYKINYQLGWATADFARALISRPSIPQTFVIAPGGRVVAHYVGYSDRIPEMIRAAIDKANGKAAE